MPASAKADRPTTRLERSKEGRRTRVVAAVLELATEGGYDAVQIRAASERSGVASDTIYRYFGSRDALISTALIDWLDRQAVAAAATGFEGETIAETLLNGFRYQWAIWERNPNMLETFVRATLAEGRRPDGAAARARETAMPAMASVLRDVDADYRDDLLMMVQHFTHSMMSSVAQGFLAVDEVFPLFERMLKRLAQHPAMSKHRPASWEWQPSNDKNPTTETR